MNSIAKLFHTAPPYRYLPRCLPLHFFHFSLFLCVSWPFGRKIFPVPLKYIYTLYETIVYTPRLPFFVFFLFFSQRLSPYGDLHIPFPCNWMTMGHRLQVQNDDDYEILFLRAGGYKMIVLWKIVNREFGANPNIIDQKSLDQSIKRI